LLSLAVLFALLVVALVVLTQLPNGVYKSWVIDAVQSATGRVLTIGDFELGIGSTLSVHATDVRLANAEWASESEMMIVGGLDAALSLRPLLTGVLDYWVKVRAPQVNLETDNSGRSNWELAKDTGELDDQPWDGDMPLRFLPRDLDVTDLKLSIVNQVVDSRNEVVLNHLKFGDQDGGLTLDMTCEVDGEPAMLAGDLGSIEKILAGESTPVQIKGHFAELSWTTEGTWSKARSPKGPTVDFMVKASLASTLFFQRFVSTSIPELGGFEYESRVVGSEGTYSADEVSIKLSGGPAEAEAKGRVGDLMGLSDIDLQLELSTHKLPEIVAGFGVQLPVDLPHSVEAHTGLKGSLTELSLEEFRGQMSAKQVQGRVNGAVDNVLTRKGLRADVEIKANTLAALSAFTGQKLPDLGPAEGSGQITFADGAYALSNLDAKVTGDDLNVDLKGKIANLENVSGLDLKLSGSVSSLARLSSLLGADLPETGALKVAATLSADAGPTGPSLVKAQLINDLLRVDTEGKIASLTAIDGLDLAVQAETDSLSELLKSAGIDWPGVRRSAANFNLVTTAGMLKGEDISLQLDDTVLRGTLVVTPASDNQRLSVKGQFHSKILDLNNLLGIDDYVEQRTQRNKAIEETGVVAPPADRFAFSDEPMPFAILNQFDADFEIGADRIDVGNIQVQNGHASLSLKAGDLQFLLNGANADGRPLEGSVQVHAGKTPTPVELRFAADDVPLSNLLGPGAILQGGRLLLDIAVEGQGQSDHKLAGSLNGTLRLVVQDSRTPKSLLARFGRSVVMQLNPFSADKEYSDVECAAMEVEIVDGQATTPRGLVFQTDAVTWTGTGSLDLKTEKINVSVKSKAREGLGIGAGRLAELAVVHGTLNQPSIAVDPKGVLTQGADLALAVGTGGLSALAEGLWDRTEGRSERCEQIVTAFRNRRPRPIATE
jgi:uncharacterized protein involved in outer membrane biogenesis